MKFSNFIVSGRGLGIQIGENWAKDCPLMAACIGLFLVIYLNFMLARCGEALRSGLGTFQGE
jgi:hypothetical protein